MTVLILPARNPDERLLSLVKELRALCPQLQILIIDDGSVSSFNDVVFDQAKFHYDCMLCRHPIQYGRGAAIKTGMGFLLGHLPGCTRIITADADGRHRAADILKVAEAMWQHPDHLILGTRMPDGAQVPARDRQGNRIIARMFRAVTGSSCPDARTGLRGIPVRYVPLALDVAGEQNEYEMHFLLRAAREGIPLMSIPIETAYPDRSSAPLMQTVKDAARIYGVILKFGAGSLLFKRKNRTPASRPETLQDADNEKVAV